MSNGIVIALIVAIAGVVWWAGKIFLGEGVKLAAQHAWPQLLRGRSRSLGPKDLDRYQTKVQANYNRHSLGFLADSSVTIDDVYVPVQYERDGIRKDAYQSVRDHDRSVVLGGAGAGKSMLLKSSMVRWAQRPADFKRIPVLVELFRCNEGDTRLEEQLAAAFKRNGVGKPERFLDKMLTDGALTVLFDGLDEVVADRRDAVASELKSFAEKYRDCQIVVTCRDAVYDHELRPHFGHELLLAEFDDAAIRRFLGLWFRSRAGEQDPRYEVEQLMAGLRASPAILRLARSPLLLTMIASLHDGDPGVGATLPSSRSEFYEEVVDHLLRRDRQLGRSNVVRFKVGHKKMALRKIALSAQGAYTGETDRRTLAEDELVRLITDVLVRFNIDRSHAQDFLAEIVNRSGLLIKVDDGNLLYGFAHTTLQEYFAAVELAGDEERLLRLHADNPARWRETVKLWCGGANRDSTSVMREMWSRDKLLALECLPEARQIDEKLAEEIIDHHLSMRWSATKRDPAVISGLGAVAADPGPRGAALLARLKNDAGYGLAYAFEALAASRLRSAVETLGEHAEAWPGARLALRRTGELALPILAARAKAGSVTAVDDIAEIGTASAGAILAELLWEREPVAIRSAWQLGCLVSNPDVTEELRQLDRARPGSDAAEGARWYPWLYEPPAGSWPDSLQVVLGRIGYLLDVEAKRGAEVPDDIGSVDPRIAMPIGVLGAAKSARLGLAVDKIKSMAEARNVDVKFGESRGSVLRHLPAVGDSASSDLAQDVLAALTVPATYRHLLAGLPQAQFRLIAWRLADGWPDAGVQSWRGRHDKPKEPSVLKWAAAATLWGVLGSLFLAGVVMSFGGWSVAPTWTSWVCLIALAVAVASLAEGLRRDSDGEDGVVVLMFFAVLVSVCGAWFVAGAQLVDWLGPLTAGALAVAWLAFATALTTLLRRRKRALANLFRELLVLDIDGQLRDGLTLISHRLRPHGRSREATNL